MKIIQPDLVDECLICDTPLFDKDNNYIVEEFLANNGVCSNRHAYELQQRYDKEYETTHEDWWITHN